MILAMVARIERKTHRHIERMIKVQEETRWDKDSVVGWLVVERSDYDKNGNLPQTAGF